MKTWPDHPGAHHFYIHAVEASTHARARPAERRPSCAIACPASGHLVHMPSHIYIRTGRYHEGVLANQRAVTVDSAYTAACHAQGMYPIGYFPHNIHFLSTCATLEGDRTVAWESAQLLRERLASDLMDDPGWETLQHYWAYPLFVAVKLGMWDELRKEAAPDSNTAYPLALWNYAQGMADLHDGNTASATARLAEIRHLEQDSVVQTMRVWGINPAVDIVRIAAAVLEGEIAAAEKKYDDAIALLAKAVEMERTLNYQEPPDWSFPVRHHLGAVQLAAGRPADAIKTYEDDLTVWKENGWALIGLQHALEAAQRGKEASAVGQRFTKAWEHADLTITSSRIL